MHARICNPNTLHAREIRKKGDIRGFGKLQETIPQGFIALEKTNSEAIFTTQDRIAKFVWLNLPASAEIKVVYKLRANEKPEGEYTIDGEFGYLLNDETQKAVIGTSKFFIGPKALEALASDASTISSIDNTDAELAARKAAEEAAAREAAAEAQRQALAREQAAKERETTVATNKTQKPATEPKRNTTAASGGIRSAAREDRACRTRT